MIEHKRVIAMNKGCMDKAAKLENLLEELETTVSNNSSIRKMLLDIRRTMKKTGSYTPKIDEELNEIERELEISV